MKRYIGGKIHGRKVYLHTNFYAEIHRGEVVWFFKIGARQSSYPILEFLMMKKKTMSKKKSLASVKRSKCTYKNI